jgi:glutaredoxin
MGKLLNFVLFAVGAYIAVQINGGIDGIYTKSVADRLAPDNQVVMYSLTTCPYCKQKRQQMTKAGIPFTEYFLDANPAKQSELDALLRAHRVPAGAVGTPTLTVNGELLINNPDLSEIKKHLRYKS